MSSFASRFTSGALTWGSAETGASRACGRATIGIYGMFRTGANVERRRIGIIVIGLLILGMIGYAGASTFYSASRVNAAERTLGSVVSHQNTLNAAFDEINTQLSALNTSAAFDSEQALTLVDRSIGSSRVAMETIDGDDAALRGAADNLRAMPWLSVVRRDSVDREASRIAHARNALAAGDYDAEAAADASVAADATRIARYDIDKIGGEIDAFYRPMVDRYNSEITAATA